MKRYDDIDLSRLPPPAFPVLLSYESIRSERLADLQARLAAAGLPFDAMVYESEPLVKVEEAGAYREILVRQRLIDAVRAVMLATSQGADLDNVVADFSLVRKTIIPANPETGAAAVMEPDGDLRRRRILAVEALSVAGPEGAYVFHALSAHPHVSDVGVYGPEAEIEDPESPGEFLTGDGRVLVVIMSSQGTGAPTTQVTDAVTTKLSAKDIRPLTDKVTVRAAAIDEYALEAVITVGQGPDAETIRLKAQERVELLVAALHAVGAPVDLDVVAAALTIFGEDGGPLVRAVSISEPAAPIAADPLRAPYCTGVTVTVEVEGG